MPKTQINIRLDSTLAAKLAERAERDGCTVSEWIRRVLTERLTYHTWVVSVRDGG
jgi:predicted HicB family RNase H-like nuclease